MRNIISTREVSSGVDLNRNYGYHYGSIDEDNAECSETFRGPNAFSEPETQAIKSLIESEPTITSAMNFHAYGNMWIHPFNYMKVKGKYPQNLDPTLLNFYEEFKFEVKSVSDSYYGNAVEMVNYSTDGEASDWMLGEYNIIAFSPELGSKNELANSFYIQKDLIVDVIDENYKVIDLFLKRNEFKMRKLKYGFNNKNELTVEFENMGLSNIFNPNFILETESKSLIQSIKRISIQTRTGEFLQTTLNKSELNDSMSIQFDKVLRFQEFKMIFHFYDSDIDNRNFSFSMTMKMENGYVFGKFNIENRQKFTGTNFFNILLITIVILLSGCVIILIKKSSLNKNSITQEVISDEQKTDSGNAVGGPDLSAQLDP